HSSRNTLLAECRHHDDRRSQPRRARGVNGLDARHPGHRDVRDHKIERALVGKVLDELGAVSGARHISAEACQTFTNGIEQLVIVVSDQYSHARQHVVIGSKERSISRRPDVPRHTSRHCSCQFSCKDDCPTMQQQARPLRPAEWPVWPEKVSAIAGAISVLIGVVVLAAWWLEIAIIVWPIPGAPAMVPNTASCFFFLGMALLLLRHAHGRQP